jgi:hypothetical protein
MAIAENHYGNGYSKVFCLNNAIQLSQADGISLCLVQGDYMVIICIYIHMYVNIDEYVCIYINRCRCFHKFIVSI